VGGANTVSVKKLPKTLKQAKRLVIVLVGAAVAAAVLTALLVATGLIDVVPETRLRSIDAVVAPWLVVGVALFVHLAFVGTVYVFFAKRIRNKTGQAIDQWSELPAVAKAAIAGLPFTVVAALAIVATDVVASALPLVVRLVVPVLVWAVVSAAAFYHLRSNDRLGGLLERFGTGTVVGCGFASGVILVDRLVGQLAVPGYVPLVALFTTAPLATAVLVRSAQRERGYLSELLVRSGFAQVRRIQSVTVALALGVLVGVIGALLASLAVGTLLVTLLVFLVVWLLGTYAALRWFRRTDVAHSDLVIVDVRERSSGRRRELAVANERDERVDLREAKIRDTGYDLYRTNIDVVLGPGQTETFDIPPGFSLFPSTEAMASDLPLGFSVSQSADAPVIVTRDGEKFKLRWADGVRERNRRGDPAGNRAPSPEADRREDNA
jgi:ABC-type multidrug transport system fused ATPase/permease subunit